MTPDLWPQAVADGWYITPRPDTADPRRPDATWAFGHADEGDYGDGRTHEAAIADAVAAWQESVDRRAASAA